MRPRLNQNLRLTSITFCADAQDDVLFDVVKRIALGEPGAELEDESTPNPKTE